MVASIGVPEPASLALVAVAGGLLVCHAADVVAVDFRIHLKGQ